MKMFGKFIAEGVNREVYEYSPDKNWVIKINKVDIEEDANSAEYFYYNLLKKYNYHHYLFECKYDRFNNFIMRKAFYPLKPGKYKLPIFFGDLRPANWGMKEDGQVACFDYHWFLDSQAIRTYREEDGVYYFKKDRTIVLQNGIVVMNYKG